MASITVKALLPDTSLLYLRKFMFDPYIKIYLASQFLGPILFMELLSVRAHLMNKIHCLRYKLMPTDMR